jgi:hypothetical protein
MRQTKSYNVFGKVTKQTQALPIGNSTGSTTLLVSDPLCQEERMKVPNTPIQSPLGLPRDLIGHVRNDPASPVNNENRSTQ